MTKRERNINEIVSGVRDDLKKETKYGLSLCTNDEIRGIFTISEPVKCLEIENVFIKMYLFNRIEESDIPGWEIKESLLYEHLKEKYLPVIRNDKIDKLID